MTLGEAVRNYRREHGLTMDEFAKLCKLSKGYVSMLEKNKNPRNGKPIVPSITTYSSIAAAMNMTVDNLMGMIDKDQPVSIVTPAPSPIPIHPDIIPIDGTRVPIVGTIAAGKPILADENIEGYAIPADGVKADFALRVKGDSMENVPILDGDIAFIRQQPIVENGEIAAILIDGEATLKRFYKRDNSVMLVAENPQYAPMIYTVENYEDFRILGKAVAYQHSLETEQEEK